MRFICLSLHLLFLFLFSCNAFIKRSIIIPKAKLSRLHATNREDDQNFLSNVDLDKYRILGWSLSYPDLSPYTPTDIPGILFLGTNLFFFYAGFSLFNSGLTPYSILVEVAGAVSLNYHYCQLKYAGTTKNSQVVKALILDYAIAVPTVLGFISELVIYYTQTGLVPVSAVELGLASISSLLLCVSQPIFLSCTYRSV